MILVTSTNGRTLKRQEYNVHRYLKTKKKFLKYLLNTKKKKKKKSIGMGNIVTPVSSVVRFD
jgi:hypothetical protein